MMKKACDCIAALQGKTLVTAESLTGGMIGGALTAVSGASAVFKGGVLSYCDEVKRDVLGVSQHDLDTFGAVSAPVAKAMAQGARKLLKADFAVSATGLAGPGGDEFGHEVGTVFLGFVSLEQVIVQEFHFEGTREEVRSQTVEAALQLILEHV